MNRVEQIIQDPDFKKAIAAIKDHAIKRWANTQPLETLEREQAYDDIQAVTRLEIALKALSQGVQLDELKAKK